MQRFSIAVSAAAPLRALPGGSRDSVAKYLGSTKDWVLSGTFVKTDCVVLSEHMGRLGSDEAWRTTEVRQVP
jgi:hypothetical protein